MTARQRILIIAFSTIESDARVLKQVRRLQQDYDVVTLGYGPSPEGAVEHFRVPDELQAWRWPRADLILRRFRRAYWGNPAVAAARRLLDGVTVDAVLANDVEAAGLALEVVPPQRVHVDLHEYAPRQKEDSVRWRLFVAPLMDWMLREWVARSGSTTTVSAQIAAEYQREYGLSPGLVINATPYSDRDTTPTPATIRLVHSGAGLANRGIELMVDAVERSIRPVTLDLFLTPNDPRFMGDLAARCERSGRTTLHPPVPYADLVDRLSGFDVGVFLLPPVNFNYRWALPNKLFDFVQARLGVVIGPSPEMSRVVEQWHLGAVTSDFSPQALTDLLDGFSSGDVDEWKRGSARAARSLSAEAQSEAWAVSIEERLRAG